MVGGGGRAEAGGLVAGVWVPGRRLSLAPSGADLQALTKAVTAAMRPVISQWLRGPDGRGRGGKGMDGIRWTARGRRASLVRACWGRSVVRTTCWWCRPCHQCARHGPILLLKVKLLALIERALEALLA